ncbi:hypothetical protein Gpo141_00006870, partial [Globisporangium polare]
MSVMNKSLVRTPKRIVTGGMHIRTLLWKNWTLKKRHPVATVLEVVLPVLFIILMSGLKTLTNNVNVPAGWSENTGSATDLSIGASYTLTNPDGYSSLLLELTFGFPVQQKKYMVTEPTLSGLLMFLGMKSASEMRDSTLLSDAQKLDCLKAVAYFGNVSTDLASPWVVPALCQDTITPYKLAIAPDNTFTRQYFLETMKKWYPRTAISNSTVDFTGGASKVVIPAFEDSVVFFKSEADLEAHITDPQYGKSLDQAKIYGAIVFDQYPDDSAVGKYSSIEYSVRMNSTQGRRGALGVVPRTLGDPAFELPFQRTIETNYNNAYGTRGFMTLQTLVTRFVNCMPVWDPATKTTTGVCQQDKAVANADPVTDDLLFQGIQNDFFIRTGLPFAFGRSVASAVKEMSAMAPTDKATLLYPLRIAPQAYFGTSVAAFPIESFLSAPFYDSVKNVFAIVFVLSYLYAISRVLVVMIQEKETRSREYMKILGVQEGSIILSWYITYTLIFLVGSIIQAIASKGGLFKNSDPFLIFLFFFLFSMSVLSFGFFISTLFSRARTGAFAGMVLFFFMYFVSSGFSAESTIGSKSGGCLLAPVALAFGVQALATVESTGVGMNFGNAGTVADNFSFNIALWLLFIDTILYTLAGLYFERVIPKEYGTTEKWYFPIMPSFWFKKRSQKVSDMIYTREEAVIEINPNVEKVSDELLQQEKNGEALVIRN